MVVVDVPLPTSGYGWYKMPGPGTRDIPTHTDITPYTLGHPLRPGSGNGGR